MPTKQQIIEELEHEIHIHQSEAVENEQRIKSLTYENQRLQKLNRKLESEISSLKMEAEATRGYKQDMLNLQNANQQIGKQLQSAKTNYERAAKDVSILEQRLKTTKEMFTKSIEAV